jgi:DNA helicase HerA-like ATPase
MRARPLRWLRALKHDPEDFLSAGIDTMAVALINRIYKQTCVESEHCRSASLDSDPDPADVMEMRLNTVNAAGQATEGQSGKPIGHVLSVNGSQVCVGIMTGRGASAAELRATVGRFLGIMCGRSLLVGVITGISMEVSALAREKGYQATAQLDLMGEIKADKAGVARFHRGVAEYPAIADPAFLISGRELRLIYDRAGAELIDIGHLQQDAEIAARINIDDMVHKHFAVLGTTGVGKSTGVAVILQQILEKRPNLRIFLLDGHNEYGRCFGDRAQILNPRNVRLPFWLFNFEEIVDVIFSGRPGTDGEVEILSEVIPLAKTNYNQYKSNDRDRTAVRRIDPKTTGYTVDTPVPYRLADLITLIDERMGKLENRGTRMDYNRLITRIETVRNDPRYAFMFDNANVGGDTMAEVLGQLFRVMPNGKPMTIMQLAGFPAEVVDSVVSVLCRMAFDFGLWSDGAVPLLFVCEEAHRYASADRSVGFGPTRKALSRIAKEGRKYGVFLGLATQRPAELDPTIISQCSTLFAMRMANDRDQELLRSAVSDAGANLLAFLPSLGTGEVLAFGEGVALPTRLKFKMLPDHLIPRSEAVSNARMGAERNMGEEFINAVIERWRGATMSGKERTEGTASHDFDFSTIGENVLLQTAQVPAVAPTQASHSGLDTDRFKILKKPLGAPAPAGSSPTPQRPPLRTPPQWPGK